MTCTITTSGTNCPSGTVRTTSCVRTETVDDDDEGSQEDVFDSVDDRLDDATHCSGPNSASFTAAFEDADGRQSAESDHAPPVFPGGQSSSRQRVYVQNNCFDNPRIVMLPIVTGGSDGSNGRRVRGFATVYLTGCYVKSQPVTEPNPSAQNKDCDDFDDDPEDCNDPDDRTDGCDYEIRGVPIHLYVSDGSLGGMTAPRTSAPVTIQVVE
jgi:hypothetical protein